MKTQSDAAYMHMDANIFRRKSELEVMYLAYKHIRKCLVDVQMAVHMYCVLNDHMRVVCGFHMLLLQ
jgi:hypothetical protein